ncbi:Deoxyribodipyrimidine photo-lyase [Nosema granulosis]|uniref:Deoxyribodipyrimidine photo-lyase n=1 Tax=Nosema granulosis TaxID=83296 RepID=A0A9P6GZF7_9MICR|nr:Deoxyribodipyrimidine photo-lyase [Nosema granulosis]
MDDRIFILGEPKDGNTLYVMRRDQRVWENYCIEYGYKISYIYKKEFILGVDLDSLKANEYQKKLMFEGFEELLETCEALNLPLISLNLDNLSSLFKTRNIANVILDFCPLRESKLITDKISKICEKAGVCFVQIDAHNIVPHAIMDVYKRNSRAVKINLFKHFFKYFKEFSNVSEHRYNETKSDFSVPEYSKHEYFPGGYTHGMKQVQYFFDHKFNLYSEQRNNPDVNYISDLSPYLHSGQISSQKVLLIAYEKFYNKDDKNLESFANEIFIWKETAEHFCCHEVNYDNINGALPWAKDTLLVHKDDKRERIYSKKQLENGKTQSSLWNAAQMELRVFNKIHGYVRMFWAKQLLKWTSSPEEALEIAIEFNDNYSLDGNDPNGYLGVMWSICGSMDQGWKERMITGKIRPMNEIKTKEYVSRWLDMKEREKYLSKRRRK